MSATTKPDNFQPIGPQWMQCFGCGVIVDELDFNRPCPTCALLKDALAPSAPQTISGVDG